MKSLALSVVAVGLLLAMAAPSFAYPPGYRYVRGYAGPYVTVRPVVVAAAPVYGYATYPAVAAPVVVPVPAPVAAPVVTQVVPGPYYYYGAPGVSVGIRGPRLGIRVRL